MPNFSHLNTNSEFPDLENVNVYKYDNQFDYGRFDIEQMKLTLCDVPWDVGEAHLGQRTISGIGNVVYFKSPEARDEWFDSLPDAIPGQDATGKAFRFSTKFKELHRDQIIDIPIPYNVAALFNYLVVEYQPFASEDDLVEYETTTGKLKWFWFVREVEFVAPNTTRLHLLDDAFQTWIYDVNIEGMILERGHAPMFQTRASQYLSNPLENNTGLLVEDVNYGNADIVKHIDVLALNAGNMLACIATSALPTGDFGTKDNGWQVPTASLATNNGVPSYNVFAVDPQNLSTLLSTFQQIAPQIFQTIQAVFFVPQDLVELDGAFTYQNITCWYLKSSRKKLNLSTITKSSFGYDPKYADIAKLYTSPYAHIEITDENGNVDVIKVEDTTGTIEVSTLLSLAYPFVNIQAHLLGIGGAASASITFKNISASTFDIAGSWYETLREWEIPTFAVISNPATEYDFSTYYNRKQEALNASTAYANTAASATTDKSNAATMAAMQKGNADRSADTDVANTALQVAGNSAITTRSNTAAGSDTYLSNELAKAMYSFDRAYTLATTNNQIKAENASAAVGAAGGVVGSAVQGLMSGGPVGAIGGLVSGAISGATSMAQTAISTNLSQEQADESIAASLSKLDSTNTNNDERTTNQNEANTDNTTTTNSTATGITANSAATAKSNATDAQTATNTTAQASYDTNIANAGREQARALADIENQLKQAALNAPQIYGSFSNGASAATKPMALIANIVTQSKSAIANAGDEFLRYGYMYDMQWPFNGNWNIGKYFTYWKLKDFWVRDLQVPDLYMDKLRFFLFGGVTIWRKPEYIGKVSVYDNFNS